MKKIKYVLLNVLVFVRLLIKQKDKSNSIIPEGIIFSMNRPLQLLALLESFYTNCKDSGQLYVIFKYTDEQYRQGYDIVKQQFTEKKVKFIEENNFETDLFTTIGEIRSKFLFFLVDDIVITRPFSFTDFTGLEKAEKYIFSLRLGKNLNYCYTKQQPQPLPRFYKLKNFLAWDWASAELDWNYVFSVDGHIYSSRLLKTVLPFTTFSGPNSFESAVNRFRFVIRRSQGVCYTESSLVNVSLNRVQNEIENISGDTSVEMLNGFLLEGKKIDISYFKGIQNKSAHITTMTIPLIGR